MPIKTAFVYASGPRAGLKGHSHAAVATVGIGMRGNGAENIIWVHIRKSELEFLTVTSLRL